MDLVEGMTCIDQAIFGVDQWQEYRRGAGWQDLSVEKKDGLSRI